MEQWLGRGLAAVSLKEMPGFEPLAGGPPELGQPMRDLARRERFDQIQWARLEHLNERIEEAQRRIAEAQSSPLMQVPEGAIEGVTLLDRQRRMLLQQIERADRGGRDEVLLEFRVAGGHALRLARGLRAAGQGDAGRKLIERYIDRGT